jgi:hypothetical protein
MPRRLDHSWLLFTTLLILFVAARSFGPRIPDADQSKYCAVNVHVTGVLGVSLNCDSPEFMRLAADPAALLEPNNAAQAKPGMIAAAAAITALIQPVSNVVPYFVAKAERADIDPSRIDHAIRNFGAAFVAYVALNILLLAISFGLLRKIVDHGAQPDLAEGIVMVTVAGLFMLTYPVTNWLLTPHTQILNTFVPLLALYYVLRVLRSDAIIDHRFFVIAGLVTGYGILSYGLFYTLIPCIIGASAIKFRRGAGDTRALVANLCLYVLLALAPMPCWYAYVRLSTGQFHYHEVAYSHAVIWIIEAAYDGMSSLVEQTVARLNFYGRSLLHLLTMSAAFALLLGCFVLIFLRHRYEIMRSVWKENGEALLACLCVSGVTLAFYIVVGEFQVRHGSAAIPPLVAALGITALALGARAPVPARNALATLCGLFLIVAFYFGATTGVDQLGKLFD